MPTTLVTGATGFLAGHCVDQLLKAGHTVIGTIRSPEKAERLAEAFKKEVESGKFELETLQDVQDEGEFQVIFEKHPEIDYILHTASPFNMKAQDPEKDMLQPAVRGTTAVLRMAKAHAPNVKKIVITSSVAAVVDPERFNDPTLTLSSKDWNPMTREQAAEKGKPDLNYIGSKLLAEKAGREFLNTEKPHFSITWVNPSYIFGPGVTLDLSAINTSNEVISGVLESKKGQEPQMMANWFVDVRDCAEAHVIALKPELDGKRLVLGTSKFCTQEIEDIANKIPQLHGKIAEGNPANVEKELQTTYNLDTKDTDEALGIKWISLSKSVTDFADQWLKLQ
ncbi:putative NADPH-dependent methylglyoxal reductase GRP2 [Yarrowia sp. B02]|nr:putative NADPH-dependent methylglyoxal reductase GRP2 [Yarrowia sp. B02]